MKNTVTQKDIQDFVEKMEIARMGKKSVVICVTLKNGFEIVESSACVDENEFDLNVGIKFAQERVESKIWELLGFKLQCDLSCDAHTNLVGTDESLGTNMTQQEMFDDKV